MPSAFSTARPQDELTKVKGTQFRSIVLTVSLATALDVVVVVVAVVVVKVVVMPKFIKFKFLRGQ